MDIDLHVDLEILVLGEVSQKEKEPKAFSFQCMTELTTKKKKK